MNRIAALLAVLAAAVAQADGGAIRIQQDAGAFRITVFSAPEPLRVGAADLSVLVQRRHDATVIVGAEVVIELAGPPPALPLDVRATHESATNKLLHAALVTVPAPGRWALVVTVRHGDDAASVRGELDVAPPLPRFVVIWPYLALPAVVVALFALRGWLEHRRAPTRD